MKKRAIISMVLAMTMLAGCAKTEQIEETTTEETTAETTVETTEATTAAPTPTPGPTATPTSEPEPTQAVPEPDEYDPNVDYYSEIMSFVASLEEEAPGENRYFTRVTYYDCLTLVVIHADGSACDYAMSDGEFVVRNEGNLEVTTYDDYTLDAEAFAQIPCIYEMGGSAVYSFIEGAPADGTYSGDVLALSEDGSSVVITCDTFIQYDEDYVSSLEVGDVVEIPGMDDATVTAINSSTGRISLDNFLMIRDGCVNTGDTHGWYLANSEDDAAYPMIDGAYELTISSSCTITETSSFDWDYDTLAEYQAEIAASDTPFAASFTGHRLTENVVFTNNGYFVSDTLRSSASIRYEVRDGEIVRIDIRYTYGL